MWDSLVSMWEAMTAFSGAFYESNGAMLFLSSVTLGTFIFAMKTFIIQTIKKEVYDTAWYGERLRQHRASDRYGPIRRLAWMLIITVSVCFGSAILNGLAIITQVGAIQVLALAAAAAMFILATAAILIVSKNTLFMLGEEAEREIIKRDKDAQAKPAN